MTHNRIPVNWRPSNLVPKPRALPASCPLSADTLPGHTAPSTPSHNAGGVPLGRTGYDLSSLDNGCPYASEIHTKPGLHLHAGLRTLLPGKLTETQSPLPVPHRAMGEGGGQTLQLSIHIVQVKHFDGPVYHIPWTDQHLTQDSFFSCPALFPQEVSSWLWHPFSTRMSPCLWRMLPGLQSLWNSPWNSWVVQTSPTPNLTPQCGFRFYSAAYCSWSICEQLFSNYLANELCVRGWRRQPGNLLPSSSPLSYLPQSPHPHHFSCNRSCNSNIYFAFVISIRFSPWLPFLTMVS